MNQLQLENAQTLEVALGERSYPIIIGSQLLSRLPNELVSQHVRGSQLVLVSNTTVAPLYLEQVKSLVGSGSKLTEVVLPDGEQHKTMETLTTIFDQVMADGHNRDTTFVAVGGGVVGDITGFAAACYQRGVNFIQIPTTLLSQVDSSVGGKTAVNHPLGKNMIGAFYQPQAVYIDVSTLDTLPQRELAAGLAEVVKYGLIGDKPFYHWLQQNMPKLLARDEAALIEAIQRSCANKADIVSQDEREGGIRAILNLGHTFGHAIETHQGYGQWLHGEAVATGMLLAMKSSQQRGWVSQADVEELEVLLKQIGLPIEPPSDMSTQDFIDLMARDKKVVDNTLHFVLLSEVGVAKKVNDVTQAELQRLLG